MLNKQEVDGEVGIYFNLSKNRDYKFGIDGFGFWKKVYDNNQNYKDGLEELEKLYFENAKKDKYFNDGLSSYRYKTLANFLLDAPLGDRQMPPENMKEYNNHVKMNLGNTLKKLIQIK